VENGNLVITAQMINGVLQSGGMSHRFSQTYGRFAFRVRTDKDPSEATSGVVLTWPTAGGWPATGENDIYETGTTGNRNPFHSFVHYGATNEQESVLHYADGSQWHDMAMEWDAKTIKIYRDGELVWTLSNAAAIPDVAHHMALQLDAAKPTMGGPVKMYVDYVRVYKRA
jgi:beta-glucanase (GH16 family)